MRTLNDKLRATLAIILAEEVVVCAAEVVAPDDPQWETFDPGILDDDACEELLARKLVTRARCAACVAHGYGDPTWHYSTTDLGRIAARLP